MCYAYIQRDDWPLNWRPFIRWSTYGWFLRRFKSWTGNRRAVVGESLFNSGVTRSFSSRLLRCGHLKSYKQNKTADCNTWPLSLFGSGLNMVLDGCQAYSTHSFYHSNSTGQKKRSKTNKLNQKILTHDVPVLFILCKQINFQFHTILRKLRNYTDCFQFIYYS